MITLHRLSLSNFLSHEDTEIHFKDSSRVLLDGRIGAGKSSIVDAIVWCLYSVARVDNRSLIRNGEASSEVDLTLKSESGFTRIARKIYRTGKHTLSIRTSVDGDVWVDIPVVGIKNMQDWIENEFLHASYALFINSIAYPQNNVDNFVKQTANKRKDLLLEIAGISSYNDLYTKAHKTIEANELKLGRIVGEIAQKEVMFQMAKNALEEMQKVDTELVLLVAKKNAIEKSLSEIDIKIAKRDELFKEFSQAEKNVKDTDERTKNTENEIKRIEDRIKTLQSFDISGELETKMRLEAVKNEISSLESLEAIVNGYDQRMLALSVKRPSSVDYSSDIALLERRISELDGMTDIKCQNCGALIPSIATKVTAQRESAVKELEEKTTAKQKLETERMEYESLVASLGTRPESNSTKIIEKKKEVYELEQKVKTFDAAKNAQSVIDELNSSLSVQKVLLDKNQKDGLMATSSFIVAKTAYQGSIFPVEEEIKANQDRTAFIQIELDMRGIEAKRSEHQAIIRLAENVKPDLDALKEEERLIRKDQEALKLTKEAFGSKGIKTVIIDFFVPKLEKSINEILEQLSDFRVEINTQKDTADGDGTIEGLYIDVVNPNGQKMEFNSYSGGERLSIIVAISEALAGLQNIGFRMLDEMFIGLDNDSIDSFVQVLNKVQNRFGQMLMISHLQNIKDLFSERIEIVKLNGISQVSHA